mmetsp:Transcript_8532/g.18071  ORF Transcript_8532/g.18071 Transcript_8532/m.18071 type:complete len:81 (-) Transcript_8532:23-265(-)
MVAMKVPMAVDRPILQKPISYQLLAKGGQVRSKSISREMIHLKGTLVVDDERVAISRPTEHMRVHDSHLIHYLVEPLRPS